MRPGLTGEGGTWTKTKEEETLQVGARRTAFFGTRTPHPTHNNNGTEKEGGNIGGGNFNAKIFYIGKVGSGGNPLYSLGLGCVSRNSADKISSRKSSFSLPLFPCLSGCPHFPTSLSIAM